MSHFFLKHRSLSMLLAVLYALFSIWTLGMRILSAFSETAAASFTQAESILSAILFLLLPCVLFFFSAHSCTANAKTAMYAGAAAKLMALAAYCISLYGADAKDLLSLIFCLSLGSAVLEILTFILTAVILRKSRTEAACSWIAAASCALHHVIYLTELYASLQLIGNGSVVKWLRILASASNAEFFISIIKGAACALVFILLYEESNPAPSTSQSSEAVNTEDFNEKNGSGKTEK